MAAGRFEKKPGAASAIRPIRKVSCHRGGAGRLARLHAIASGATAWAEAPRCRRTAARMAGPDAQPAGPAHRCCRCSSSGAPDAINARRALRQSSWSFPGPAEPAASSGPAKRRHGRISRATVRAAGLHSDRSRPRLAGQRGFRCGTNRPANSSGRPFTATNTPPIERGVAPAEKKLHMGCENGQCADLQRRNCDASLGR